MTCSCQSMQLERAHATLKCKLDMGCLDGRNTPAFVCNLVNHNNTATDTVTTGIMMASHSCTASLERIATRPAEQDFLKALPESNHSSNQPAVKPRSASMSASRRPPSKLRHCQSVSTPVTATAPSYRPKSYSLSQLDVMTAVATIQAKREGASPFPVLYAFDMSRIMQRLRAWPEPLQRNIRSLIDGVHGLEDGANLALRQRYLHNRDTQGAATPPTCDEDRRIALAARDQLHSNLVDLGFRLLSKLQSRQIDILRAINDMCDRDRYETQGLARADIDLLFDSLKHHYAQQREGWASFDRKYFAMSRTLGTPETAC
ncbi:uncharacterized protein MONBRDRAFT_38009 [Monosiga brevicollis MX1]|uniref:Uncharacterized protein n=1 Tax=Monosiga brevicollis TaxID=81824 RepID=A9V558_MONBE|nr:uncharacterized protein MONBRDRAFT_38009 [Monosiga brevicollis MX1]EDQ87217.1 predicted protein [Monosiga brevicollis MX1]|eukprot:XP_001747830.1 hypothetical protein [Monosiga brevicollis MX1]